jgi:hypothetical protein
MERVLMNRHGPLWFKRCMVCVMSAVVWLYALDAAAGGGKPAKKLVNVADTRDLGPGITKWIADLYNTSHWQFGLAVVLIMAAMGLVLGVACDRLVGLLGINLGKIQHHE